VEILSTDRLSLRTWTEADLNAGYAIWGDAEVMRFIGSGEPNALEEIRASIQTGIRHQQKYGHQHWAVVEKFSGKIIGACGFNRTENDGEIELVFHFENDSWGKGFATEAVKGCIEFASRTLKPTKIVASCHPDNIASKRVLQKEGFTYRGDRWFEDTSTEEPCFELVI
jgi:ribosomal-protein-alanine N-acetyltransferase